MKQAQLGVGCVYHRGSDGGNEFVVGNPRETGDFVTEVARARASPDVGDRAKALALADSISV